MAESMYSRLNSGAHSRARWTVRLVVAPAFLWYCSAQAEKLPQNLQIHGFASQSWLMSSDNNLFGKSSSGSGSFDFRELGLNASMRPLPKLQFSAQMLSRWAGAGSGGNVRLDYGFIDYTVFSGETNQLGLRLGRMKNPLGFYNDTRDVPFTRPSILLPQSIYFDRTRKLALAADGVHIYGERRSDRGDISFQAGVARPLVRGDEAEVAVFSQLVAGHLSPELSYIGRVNYELDGGRIRFAVSATQLNMSYSPAGANDMNTGSIHFLPIIFSAQYNAERWSLTSEYAFRNLKYKNFGPAIPDLDFSGESYYFQGVYRITPEWEAIARYDVLYMDSDDRNGRKWAASGVGTRRQAHNRFAKDITVGLRWNITPEFMLRAEYHRVNGTGWLSTLDNPNTVDMSQHWNLFSILGSFRF